MTLPCVQSLTVKGMLDLPIFNQVRTDHCGGPYHPFPAKHFPQGLIFEDSVLQGNDAADAQVPYAGQRNLRISCFDSDKKEISILQAGCFGIGGQGYTEVIQPCNMQTLVLHRFHVTLTGQHRHLDAPARWGPRRPHR